MKPSRPNWVSSLSSLWEYPLPLPDIFNIKIQCQSSAPSFWVSPVETALETVKAEPIYFGIQQKA